MEWRDQGILLNVSQHGENAVIIEVLTLEHGRYAGVVLGGRSHKIKPTLQIGAQLDLVWRARLEDHLGTFKVELIRSRNALVMSNRQALAGLNSVIAMLLIFIPEREVCTSLCVATEQLLDVIDRQDFWPQVYLKWELAMLNILGFGLNLSTCAVTGVSENLNYISPKSGNAISTEAAGKWASRLLPFPRLLKDQTTGDIFEVKEALDITGYFFKNHVAKALGIKKLPASRDRFLSELV